MVSYLEEHRADRPLCLPRNSAPPTSGTCWSTFPSQLLLLFPLQNAEEVSPSLHRNPHYPPSGKHRAAWPGRLPCLDGISARPARCPDRSASAPGRVRGQPRRPTPHLPAAAAARSLACRSAAPTDRMKSSPPRAGSPHSAPARGERDLSRPQGRAPANCGGWPPSRCGFQVYFLWMLEQRKRHWMADRERRA